MNADDFGLSHGVCRGIVEAMTRGLVSATTAMVCMPGAPERIARYAPALGGRVGLHLQLTGGGRPCLPPGEIPSLVTPAGRFPRNPDQVVHPDPDQAAREWRAQVDRLRALGLEPSHLDSHHHIHLHPGLFPVFAELAAELGIPARNADPSRASELTRRGVPVADACLIDWFDRNISLSGLLACLERGYAGAGGVGGAGGAGGAGGVKTGKILELMCHPGYSDAELRAVSSYASQRQAELAVLTAPETARALAELGIEVVGVDVLRA